MPYASSSFTATFARPDRLAVLVCAAITLAGCVQQLGGNSSNTNRSDAVIDDMARSAALAADRTRDFEAAAGNWNMLYQRHPDDPDLALSLARDLRLGGHAQPAIDVAAPFVERHGPAPAMLAELGKDYLAADRLGLAERTLRQAADAAPSDWQVLSALGVAVDYQGNHAQAQEAYERALAVSPNNPVLLNNLGLSQAQSGHLAEAQATLRRAVDQPAATAQVRQNLALIEALSGDPAAAERLSRQDLPPEMVRANAAYFKLLAGAQRP
jgi:Flp pilus assembly protein TadD